jgi:hypothetical protein
VPRAPLRGHKVRVTFSLWEVAVTGHTTQQPGWALTLLGAYKSDPLVCSVTMHSTPLAGSAQEALVSLTHAREYSRTDVTLIAMSPGATSGSTVMLEPAPSALVPLK